MVLIFDTRAPGASGLEVTLPLYGTVNATVNWGDGSSDTYNTSGAKTHAYASAGAYEVKISEALECFGTGNAYTNANKLVEVRDFGELGLRYLPGAFYGAGNLTTVPASLPAGIVSTRRMFSGASLFNQDISGWNVGAVTDMSGMFADAPAFNQDIGAWNVSNVTDMSYMFANASSFNQNLNSWDVGKVTFMSGMFSNATSFDGDVDSWNVGNVTTMDYMFRNAVSFSGDLSGWDVGRVTDMSSMFRDATSFNSSLANWDVGAVTSMAYMFANAVSFNGEIGGWDVGKVTDMSGMFMIALSFNRDIGGWNTGAVTSMDNMFNKAAAFDQDIGGWDIAMVADMNSMFADAGLSAANYNALLTCWAAQEVQESVRFHGGGSRYFPGPAADARDELITSHGWTISDSGLVPPMQLLFDTDAPTASGLEVTLPLAGTVNVWVDWGDGNTDHYTEAGNNSHTYASAGQYTVSIRGELSQFGNGEVYESANKLLEVLSFGELGLTSLSGAFAGATNLTTVPALLPLGITDLSHTFKMASSFNQDIGSWDVGEVTTMAGIFENASSFNQNIGNWDVAKVEDMELMFHRASTFNQDIGQWDVSSVGNMSDMFSRAVSFNGDIRSWDVSNVTDMSAMFAKSAFNQDISGWDVSNVTDMSAMFYGNEVFDQNIGKWNVSSVANMYAMFDQATAFNQPLGEWDVSNVTNMSRMFYLAYYFNQSIGNWNVSNVSDMGSMFCKAFRFDQNIGAWDVGKVTNMSGMFENATAFNQDIGNWNVSGVTSMAKMFAIASAFDQDIGNWNTENVTDMAGMFNGASAFNQDISNWNTENVIKMSNMFSGAVRFNQNIGHWNVGNVTNMSLMFSGASAFNQDIGAWDISKVTDLSDMFAQATSFNQDISAWNTSKVQNMSGLFLLAALFNQNIGNWDISSVEQAEEMFGGVRLSIANYDSLLIGWSKQEVQADVSFHGGYSHYSPGPAAEARAHLVEEHGWMITDGGLIPYPAVTTLAASGIGIQTAAGNGTIIHLGSSNPTAYGICWSTSGMPTVDDNATDEGPASDTGNFSSTLTGLTPATRYYVRAYATNDSGTAYGSVDSFTTSKRQQIITFSLPADTLTYGDAGIALEASASSGLAVQYAVVSGPGLISGDSLYCAGAGRVVVAAAQPGNGEYEPAAEVIDSLDVQARPLTITAHPLSKMYGEPDPQFTWYIDGVLVGGDTVAGSLARQAGEDAGTYAIGLGTISAGAGYAITFVGADFTISPAVPNVSTWPAASTVAIGNSLGSAVLSGGSASVAGTFSFARPDSLPPGAGTHHYEVVFTPDDESNYTVVRGSVQVTVDAATPVVYEGPAEAAGVPAGIYAVRNPAPLSGGGFEFVVVYPEPAYVTATVFDAMGNLLDRLEGRASVAGRGGRLRWDLRNRDGQTVAGGSYMIFARVTDRRGNETVFRLQVGVKQ